MPTTTMPTTMTDLAAELYPLHRSLTGPGVRATLARIAEEVPLEIHEVPTGTRVFDWEIPDEWTLRDAYVADEGGRRLIDVRRSNLHVVGYSQPVRRRMPWRELRERVHTLPDRPQWVPYRTAYFDDAWGFCLDHDSAAALDRDPEREVEVVIDAELAPGALTWGEVLIPGETTDEILIWTHVCHPSLADDNLSGIVVAAALAAAAREAPPRRLGLRFVFAPATLGALAWLWTRREELDRVRAGLVLALLGRPGGLVYKRSRRGDAEIDRAARAVLDAAGRPHEIRPFRPTGYDERQFCSPGFDLPVGRLTRTPHGEFPEYHTSADDLAGLSADALEEARATVAAILDVLQGSATYTNLRPFGEPRLAPLGLYDGFGRGDARAAFTEAVQWVLNLSDGRHDLLAIAARSGLSFDVVRRAADVLLDRGLLAEVPADPHATEEKR